MVLKANRTGAVALDSAYELSAVEVRLICELAGVPRMAPAELRVLAASSDWSMFRRSAGVRLWPLLAHRIRERELTVPSVLLAHLDEARRGNAIAWMRRRRALREVLAALAAAGMEATVLKGMALAPVVYPAPELRTMSDIDIWVHAPLEVIPRLLAPLGWAIAPRHDTGMVDGRLTIGLALGDPPLVLEAHRVPGSLAKSVSRLLPRVLERRTRGPDWWTLAPGDQLLHAILHSAVHHRFSAVLPGILDIALLVEHARDQVDWAAWGAECRAQGVERVAAACLSAAAQLFGARVPQIAWTALTVDDASELGRVTAAAVWWSHATGENPEAVLSARGGEGVVRAIWKQLALILQDRDAGRPGAARRLVRRLWGFGRYTMPRHIRSIASGKRSGAAGEARRVVRERHEALMRSLGC